MPKDLKEPQIQDTADVLSEKYTHNDLNDILLRFDATHLDEGSSKSERITNWLRNGNESGEARSILAYMIENCYLHPDEREELEQALAGSRFALTEGEDGVKLWLRISAAAERQAETHRSFVKEHATDEVLDAIEDARTEMTAGNYDDAMEDLRKALENMVDDNYHEALDELVSESLISDGSGNHRDDKEMLYMPYDYCSTVGSHTSAGIPPASQLQAETALILVEEAIHFILQKLEEANEQRISLNGWVT